MTEPLSVVEIKLEPVEGGWRAVIYVDNKALKMSPLCEDRDMAMLYAMEMERVARSLAEKDATP